MLNEESTKLFAPFAQNAVIAFLLSRISVAFFMFFVVFCVAFFINIPLLYIISFLTLLILSIFFIWYSKEFFKTFIYEPRRTFFFSRKGVITPSYTLILYENIQDVHLEQSIFDRIFGLWKVKIYTATHSPRGADNIFGLSYESANKLKMEILAKMKEVKQIVD